MNKTILLSVILALSCSALCMGEVTHPDSIKVRDIPLKQAGQGILARWFIKGCNMALYVEHDVTKETVLKDGARCLEFYYYRNIKADQFAHAAWKSIEENWTKKEIAAEKKNIDKLHAIYKDVSKGDRYRLMYVPNIGTTLFLNGVPLGTVKGSDFAKIYYSVWLGAQPIDKGLKEDLTGNLK